VENKIIFHANIDDDPTDFTRLQDFAELSLDHVVADAITDRAKYTGFNVVKSAVSRTVSWVGMSFPDNLAPTISLAANSVAVICSALGTPLGFIEAVGWKVN